MCGRYTLTADLKKVADRFAAPLPPASATYNPRFNIAPTQTVIVVGDDGKRYMKEMIWGLIPSWAKDPGIGNRMINARVETLAEKPAFRAALKKRRCIIPADGFYEWQKLGKVKQPVRIVLKSREPFGFAGPVGTLAVARGQGSAELYHRHNRSQRTAETRSRAGCR